MPHTFQFQRMRPPMWLVLLRRTPPHEDTLNGSILNVASVIKNVVASEAESVVGACFQNAQSGAPLRVTLTELGHIQPATPLRTDNSTAYGILNETIKQKRSKSMDMRYHWLTDRVNKTKKKFISGQGVKILETITQNIIQHNITKICAD
jgi:hypothetical protein